MTVSRIYVPRELQKGELCTLTDEDSQYVSSVLRMKKGDRLLLFDGMGGEYEAVIAGHARRRVGVEITGKISMGATGGEITLAQALPKAQKMDSIIERACELGVSRILPFTSARSVPRLMPDRAAQKLARWRKIALEAARKSHSGRIPEVEPVQPLAEMLGAAEDKDLKFIFWEEEERLHLKQVLHKGGDKTNLDFFLAVGPEGGFEEEEIRLAEGAGFLSVSLGRQVLKVETASLAILSIVQYERGAFGRTGKKGAA